MNKKIFIFLTFIGLIGLFASCEKDEIRVIMSSDPIPPTLLTIPDLTLQRINATDTLVFVGTPVDPGFVASANYFLEACEAGNNFVDVVPIFSGTQDTLITITVSDLNGLLIKKIPANVASSIDFRIRAALVVDAGTGALGTGTDPLEYNSVVSTVSVTVFGLTSLDLIDSGMAQKIESPNGDGVYNGIIKFDPANPFTLNDPITGTNYGGSAGTLEVDGAGIAEADAGWYKLGVNTNTLAYTMDAFFIGLVGSATPNDWDSPDQKMDYDAATGTWSITLDLVDGEFKFRLNDGWAWNLGGTEDNLVHNGDNVAATAGNYTITLTITNDTVGSESGTFTIVKNS